MSEAAKTALKGAVGGDLLEAAAEELSDFVEAHSGPILSPSSPDGLAHSVASADNPTSGSAVPPLVVAGLTLHAMSGSADVVAETPRFSGAIRGALREEGWKVSSKAVSKFASVGAKFALGGAVALAAYDFGAAYRKCMKQ